MSGFIAECEQCNDSGFYLSDGKSPLALGRWYVNVNPLWVRCQCSLMGGEASAVESDVYEKRQ